MTATIGLLILAAVVCAGIFISVRRVRAVFVRENNRIDCLIADTLADIDFDKWEAANDWNVDNRWSM